MDAYAEGGEHVDWTSPHLRRRVGAAVEGFQGQGRGHGGVDPGEGAGALVEGIWGDPGEQSFPDVCTRRPRFLDPYESLGRALEGGEGRKGFSKIDNGDGIRSGNLRSGHG